MSLNSRILFLFFAFVLNSGLFAQKYNFEGNFIEISLGSKYANTYLESLSEKQLIGLFAGSTIKYHNIKAERFIWAEIGADYGFYNLNNFPNYENRTADHISGLYNFGYLNVAHEFNQMTYLYAGVTLRGRGVYNNILDIGNNSENYVILNNLGPTAMLHYTFYLWKKWWNIEWQLSIPLMSYYISPDWAVNTPNQGLGSSDFVFVPNFYEIDSQLRLILPLGNKNKLSFTYAWDYYNLSDVEASGINKNIIQSASHSLFLSLIFNLDFSQPWGTN
jgi:hypothetical protein